MKSMCKPSYKRSENAVNQILTIICITHYTSQMRNFDPDTFELTFRDKKYQFLEAVNAVNKLLEVSNVEASKMTR